MEPNTNQVTPQTNTITTTDAKKSSSNVLMILILAVLFVIFGLLIYSINMNNEADYVSVVKPTNYLNEAKIPTPSVQGEVEGTDSIDVGSIDTELQDLTTDLQGL